MLASVWRKWSLPAQCNVGGNAGWCGHCRTALCACVLSPQLCLTLCDPVDCSPPGSSVHGTLQVRILQWVAMPSSRGSSQPRDWTCISMSPASAGGLFTTSATWEAPENSNRDSSTKPGIKLPYDLTIPLLLGRRPWGSRNWKQQRTCEQCEKDMCSQCPCSTIYNN